MKPKPSLLEQAKQFKHKTAMGKLPEEELELVQAWLEDEVTITQIAKVLEINTGNVYVMLARGAKELLRKAK